MSNTDYSADETNDISISGQDGRGSIVSVSVGVGGVARDRRSSEQCSTDRGASVRAPGPGQWRGAGDRGSRCGTTSGAGGLGGDPTGEGGYLDFLNHDFTTESIKFYEN